MKIIVATEEEVIKTMVFGRCQWQGFWRNNNPYSHAFEGQVQAHVYSTFGHR